MGLYKIMVMGLRGERKELVVCNTTEQFNRLTVQDLHIKISEMFPDEDPDRIALIFADERLEDESALLIDYGIQHLSVVQLVLQVDGGGSMPPKSADDLEDFTTSGDKKKSRSMECLAGLDKMEKL